MAGRKTFRRWVAAVVLAAGPCGCRRHATAPQEPSGDSVAPRADAAARGSAEAEAQPKTQPKAPQQDAVEGREAAATRSKPPTTKTLGPPDAAEKARLIRAAKQALALANAPLDRKTTVTVDGEEATVTFHLPPGMLGGDFIVKVDRTTGGIVDVKLWQ